MTVYIDLLLTENLIMNYVILSTTAFLGKKKIKKIRLLVGALIGALYVFITFFPELKNYFTLFARICFSMIIIAVTFWEESIREFVKMLILFYLSSFLFGGIALGFLYFLNTEMIYYNGVPYITNYNLFKTLMLTVSLGYLIIKASWRFLITRFNREDVTVIVDINFNGKTIQSQGIVDTGNSLRDPVSNMPVMVAEYDILKNILPNELDKMFLEKTEEDFQMLPEFISKSGLIGRFRLIPFTSLGKNNGMLLGFRPDKVLVKKNNKITEYKEVIVGIYNKKLSNDDTYTSLISIEMT